MTLVSRTIYPPAPFKQARRNRPLRQDASDLVRQVENGEEIEITVSGRPAARMVSAAPKRWQRWDDLADLFTGRADSDWQRDVDLVDQSVANPWERAR